jgi:hypothetical protein
MPGNLRPWAGDRSAGCCAGSNQPNDPRPKETAEKNWRS